MKNTKIMLLGIVILLLAIWCAALSGNSGSILGGVSICLMPVGLLIFLVGFLRSSKTNDNLTKERD